MSRWLRIRKQGGYCTRYWGLGLKIFLDIGSNWSSPSIGIEVDFLCFYATVYLMFSKVRP